MQSKSHLGDHYVPKVGARRVETYSREDMFPKCMAQAAQSGGRRMEPHSMRRSHASGRDNYRDGIAWKYLTACRQHGIWWRRYFLFSSSSSFSPLPLSPSPYRLIFCLLFWSSSGVSEVGPRLSAVSGIPFDAITCRTVEEELGQHCPRALKPDKQAPTRGGPDKTSRKGTSRRDRFLLFLRPLLSALP